MLFTPTDIGSGSASDGSGLHPEMVLAYQKLVHDYVRTLTPLSLCTVHPEKPERGSILAMLADHRRAAKFTHQA